MRVSHRAFKCLTAGVILSLSTSVSKKKSECFVTGHMFLSFVYFFIIIIEKAEI